MDWNAVITEIGGGLPAAVIAALAFVYWQKDKQLAASQEARFEMIQKLTEVAERSTATNEKLVHAVTSLTVEHRREGK